MVQTISAESLEENGLRLRDMVGYYRDYYVEDGRLVVPPYWTEDEKDRAMAVDSWKRGGTLVVTRLATPEEIELFNFPYEPAIAIYVQAARLRKPATPDLKVISSETPVLAPAKLAA